MGKSENATDYRKELVKYFEIIGSKHGVWKVFSDFMEISAISIQNSMKPHNFYELEEKYKSVINQYEKEYQNYLVEMFALLVCELQKQVDAGKVVDVLGEIFHELGLHSKYNGQFFTPNHLAEFMGEITFCESGQAIAEKGYITVSEPCSGGGAMIFGFASAMKNNKFNYNKQMVVEAVDIDIKCVHMTYIQCALYGIPAVVIHGNSLSLEAWSKWYTPVYIMDGWYFKRYSNVRNTKEDSTFDINIEKSKVGNQVSLF